MLCSEIMIEFLAENYIVWAWDISEESNRQMYVRISETEFAMVFVLSRLIESWKEYFPNESFIRFWKYQCPMLIGIKREFSLENNFLAKYEIEELLQDGISVRTDEEVDFEILLYQLIVFKEEFDRNERYLVRNQHVLIDILAIHLILVIGFRSKDCFLSRTRSRNSRISALK